MLWAAIEFVFPGSVDAKERCVHFQGAAARVVGAVDFETVAVVGATGDIEDHDVVEEVGAGEAEAVVTVGLGEVGFVLVIVGMGHLRQALVISIN